MPLRMPYRRKYGNTPKVLDGYRFDSQREAARYQELKYRQLAGEIRELQVHPVFPITVATCSGNTEQVGKYTADFRYREGPTGLLRIEDVKSPATRRTTAYRLRKKLVETIYGIVITEVL